MNAIIQLIGSLFGGAAQGAVALPRTPEQDRSLRLLRYFLNEAVPYGKDALRIPNGPLILEILGQASSRQDLLNALPPVSDVEVTDYQNKLRENAKLFKKATGRRAKMADKRAYAASRDDLMSFYESRYGNFVQLDVLGLKEELVPIHKRMSLWFQDFADGLVEPGLREGEVAWWKSVPGLSCFLYFGAVSAGILVAVVAAILIGLWGLGLEPVQKALKGVAGGATYLWSCLPFGGWLSSAGRVLSALIGGTITILTVVAFVLMLGFAGHFAWSWYKGHDLPQCISWKFHLGVDENPAPRGSGWRIVRPDGTRVPLTPAPSRPVPPAFTPGVCPAEILAGTPTRAQAMERIVDYGEVYPRRYHSVIAACEDEVLALPQ